MEKKTPLRSCVGCREKKEKRALVRVVRTPEGNFLIDRTGRANGRGAYLCDDRECLKKARKSRGLERSFRCAIDESVYGALEEELKQT